MCGGARGRRASKHPKPRANTTKHIGQHMRLAQRPRLRCDEMTAPNTESCGEGKKRRAEKDADRETRMCGGQRCVDKRRRGGRGGFAEVACVRVAPCESPLAQVDTDRHVSPTERHPHITDALQGADEGRALGLPNPGSSVFHVLLLPTMLSRISRRSLSVNLKPVCYAKGIRPGWQ